MRIRASEVFVTSFAVMLVAIGIVGGCASDKAQVGKRIAPLETEKSASPRPWKRYGDWPQSNWKDFNTLVTNASPPVSRPPAVEYPIQGDAEKGKKLAFDRSRGGSCVACHVMGASTPSLPGNVGPDLSAIGAQRPDEWLFGYVWDARNTNPETVMPPWGTNKLFSADEIKDIVAFLKTLKTSYAFKDGKEDPNRRKLPLTTGTRWTRPRILRSLRSTKARRSTLSPGQTAVPAPPAMPTRQSSSEAGLRPCPTMSRA